MERNTSQMAHLLTFIRLNWISFTLATLGLIALVSLWPQEGLPSLPGNDKSHHLIAYAVLMFPLALRKPDHWISIGFLFVAYGGLIELIQPYVNRSGEWLDLVADSAGLLCGLILAQLADRYFPAVPTGEQLERTNQNRSRGLSPENPNR